MGNNTKTYKQTPIGLIRLDLAKPLDETDKAQYFHLVVGPDL